MRMLSHWWLGNRKVTVGFVVTLVGLFLLSACDTMSVNSLYDGDSESDIVLERALTGSWTTVDGKCTTVLTIAHQDKVYDLQSVEQGDGCANVGSKMHQQARLLKLDGHYFLDASALKSDVCDTCLAMHWIALAKFDKDTLALTPIDSAGLRKLLRSGRVALSTLPEDPNISGLGIEGLTILTSLSKDLKDFCRHYANDESVFKPDSAVTLRRL